MDKFILVPSDLYNNILKRDTGEINIENAKSSTDKILNKRNMNKSTQNILYNQELKRLLKLRKEVANKPVKVQLTNGSHLFIDPLDFLKFIKSIFTKKKKTKVGAQYQGADDDNESETGFLSFPDLKEEEEEEEEIAKKEPAQNLFEQTLKMEDLKPTASSTPKTKSQVIQEKKEALLKAIKENEDEFGIRGNQILHKEGGAPIYNSDIKLSLNRIINPHVKNAPSPPGTSALASRLKRSELTKDILKARGPTIPSPRKTQTSQKAQYGKGLLKKKSIEKCIKRKNKRFCPKKWI